MGNQMMRGCNINLQKINIFDFLKSNLNEYEQDGFSLFLRIYSLNTHSIL